VKKYGDARVRITTSSARIRTGPARITRSARLSPCAEVPPVRPSVRVAVATLMPPLVDVPSGRGVPEGNGV
jgi:hypothetical protein